MTGKFKIIFEGKLPPDLPQAEVREKLLKLYKNDHRSVDCFFSGKRLVVKKDMGHAEAVKIREVLEKAGVPCQIIRDEPAGPKAVAKPVNPDPVTNSTTQPLPQQKSYEDKSSSEQQQEAVSYDLFFRSIIAESWGLISGIKGRIIGAGLIAAIISAVISSMGYGITLLIGEPGRNFYISYAILYGAGVFTSPLNAGMFMMGVKRACGEPAEVTMIFRCFKAQFFLLSLILTLIDYMIFALLLSLGVDHFYARASSILTLPVFAIAAPLVLEAGLDPFSAISRFLGMLGRHFLLMTGIFSALICINIFGSLVLIGFIWTVPLFYIASGVLFRNLLYEEQPHGYAERYSGGLNSAAASRGIPRKVPQPVMHGSNGQNVLAVILVLLIIGCAATRLWAIYMCNGIYLPDHVAANSSSVCVNADKTLYFLSHEGRMLRRVELSALGLNREPADLELLEDGRLLIGDMDKKTILLCSMDNLSCRTIGPPNKYMIADNFRFFADEKRHLLFIADINNHRILVQDMDGSYYRIIESPSKIDYPNDMTMDEQGMLWVSNTMHERILCFQVNDNSVSETARVINLNPLKSGMAAMGEALLQTNDKKQTIEDLKAARRDIEALKNDIPAAARDLIHVRPAALAWGPEGNLWVVASDPVRTTAGIRIFDPAGRQVRSFHLDSRALPEDIVRIGDRLLIADTGLFQIFTARSDSTELSPFGDETFQRALADSRNRLERYEMIGKWSKRLLLMLSIVTVVLLLIILRTRRAAAKQ